MIEALRTEEGRYRNVNYNLRLTSRTFDPKAPDASGEVSSDRRAEWPSKATASPTAAKEVPGSSRSNVARRKYRPVTARGPAR